MVTKSHKLLSIPVFLYVINQWFVFIRLTCICIGHYIMSRTPRATGARALSKRQCHINNYQQTNVTFDWCSRYRHYLSIEKKNILIRSGCLILNSGKYLIGFFFYTKSITIHWYDALTFAFVNKWACSVLRKKRLTQSQSGHFAKNSLQTLVYYFHRTCGLNVFQDVLFPSE